MTKTEQLVERIVVTFVEAAGAYLIVIPTVNWTKTVIAGAVGAGLSAVYNVVRQSEPTIVSTPTVTVAPSVPMNGVEQLTSDPTTPVEPVGTIQPDLKS